MLKKSFDTSNYEVNRLLSTGKNKTVIGLKKHELGGKIMTECAAHRPITYSCLMYEGRNNRKAKGRKINLIIIKTASQQRFKSEAHNVYNEQVKKIALSRNDDKRLQTFIELHHILMV